MKKHILIFLTIISALTLKPQTFNIVSQYCFGGEDWEGARTIILYDSGYYLGCNTSSVGGDISYNHGDEDYWLVKTNTTGQIVWENTFGGSQGDYFLQMLRTPEGGFLMFGDTYSQDGDVGCNHSSNGDWWLVKTDSKGKKEWTRCLGGTHKEYASQIKFAHEGGYILLGTTGSVDGDVAYNHGMYDVWVVKIDWDGNILWERTFGGSGSDYGYAISLSDDGGYIVGGYVNSNNGDANCREGLPGEYGSAWLLKLDNQGQLLWQQCYGGSYAETTADILQTIDGGFLFLGGTASGNGDANCFHGTPGNTATSDMWVVKVDSTGQIEWQRCLGGTGYDLPRMIRPLEDGGFIVGGNTNSQDGDALCNESLQGGHTVILHRLSAQGDLLWTKCLGSPVDNSLFSMHVFSPTHYLLGATARSNGIDVNCTLKGQTDIWLVEIMDTTVSIQEQRPAATTAAFLLYPNPATTTTWLQLPEYTAQSPMQLQLISPRGGVVYEATAGGRFHQLSTAHLPAGLYLVRLWDGEKWLVQKLVKE